MKRKWIISTTVFFAFCSFYYLGCNKTDHPFGIDAPHGLDIPTNTPTPSTGAIEVYVFDSGYPIQSVDITLIDPLGNTTSTQKTQPGVGYSAFNPNNLIAGTWTARCPSQSVSYVLNPNTSPSTILRYYGNSSLPITVSGSGQYAVSFTTGGNTVQIAPVSQAWNLSIPVNLPVTAVYLENGNLDVPVSVSMSGIPNIAGINALNPTSFVFGQGVTTAPVTIAKNICYSTDIPFALTAKDFAGNPITTIGATIGHSYPVSLLFYTYRIPSLYAECVFQFAGTNDCGTSWNSYIQSTHSNTIFFNGTIAPGQSVTIMDSDSNDNLNFVVSSYICTKNGNINVFSIPYIPWLLFASYTLY